MTASARRSVRASVKRGLEMRQSVAAVLEQGMAGLPKWLGEPRGEWEFPASLGGPESPECGCALCKLKLAQAARGTARAARRLLDVDNDELLWIAQAYHSAGEVRDPPDRRASARTTARRLVRGAGDILGSSDFCPGARATSRPARVTPSSEPQAEPADEPVRAGPSFAGRFDAAPCAPSSVTVRAFPEPPVFATQILAGGAPSLGVPLFPLRALGLPARELERVPQYLGPTLRWDPPFEPGRRAFYGYRGLPLSNFRPSDIPPGDSRLGIFPPWPPPAARVWEVACIRGRKLSPRGGGFELGVPPQRRGGNRRGASLPGGFCRGEGAALRSSAFSKKMGDVDTILATDSKAMSPGLGAAELKAALSDYVDGLSGSVVRALRSSPLWVADEGPRALEPLGVLPGVASPAVTRAALGALAKWVEPVDWARVA